MNKNNSGVLGHGKALAIRIGHHASTHSDCPDQGPRSKGHARDPVRTMINDPLAINDEVSLIYKDEPNQEHLYCDEGDLIDGTDLGDTYEE